MDDALIVVQVELSNKPGLLKKYLDLLQISVLGQQSGEATMVALAAKMVELKISLVDLSMLAVGILAKNNRQLSRFNTIETITECVPSPHRRDKDERGGIIVNWVYNGHRERRCPDCIGRRDRCISVTTTSGVHYRKTRATIHRHYNPVQPDGGVPEGCQYCPRRC